MHTVGLFIYFQIKIKKLARLNLVLRTTNGYVIKRKYLQRAAVLPAMTVSSSVHENVLYNSNLFIVDLEEIARQFTQNSNSMLDRGWRTCNNAADTDS